jgi:peptidyl-prolyl cis-trans isomerase SurA
MLQRTIARLGRSAGLVLALGTATALAAQTVSDSELPAAGLDLPANLQIFGKADPNIRKPTAIVNDAVITGTDVDQRLALLVALQNARLNEDERQRLRLQILRTLIDETLQIQEAKANEITVTQAEVNQSFARVSQRYGRTPEAFSNYLRTVGSSDRSIKRQIEGELAWTRLLRRRVEPFVNVGEEEVQAIIDRLNASKGTEEFHVMEIYLSAPSGRENEVFAFGKSLIEKMRNPDPAQRETFDQLAAKYSEATTRATGGDLDWVRPAMLPDALAQAVVGMQTGQVAGPIEIPGGFSIIYLADKRQVLTADARDAKLNLRQVAIKFPAGTSQAQAAARAAEFAKVTSEIRGCGDVAAKVEPLGAEVVDNDSVRIRDLPQALQEIMIKLQIGQSTPPFGSPQEGVRVLVLCGRDDVQTAGLPSAQQIQGRLEEQRVNLRAQSMLRNLRRDAVVEYR